MFARVKGNMSVEGNGTMCLLDKTLRVKLSDIPGAFRVMNKSKTKT